MAIILGFSFGGIIVNAALVDWEENPISTTIMTFSHPIEEIQFPTIFVCTENDYDRWDYVRGELSKKANECTAEMEEVNFKTLKGS